MSIRGSSVDLGGLFGAIAGNTPTKNPLYGAKIDDDGNIMLPDGQGGYNTMSPEDTAAKFKAMNDSGTDTSSFSKPYADPNWGQRVFNPQLANNITQANMAGTIAQTQANAGEATRKAIALGIMKNNPALAQSGLNPEEEYSMFGNRAFVTPSESNAETQALSTGVTGAPSLLGDTYGKMAINEAKFREKEQPITQATESASNKLGLTNVIGAVGRAPIVNAAQDILSKIGLGQAQGEESRLPVTEATKNIEAGTRKTEAETSGALAEGANKLRSVLAGTQANNILRQLVESTYGPVAASPFAVTNALDKAGGVTSSVVHNPNFINMMEQMKGKMQPTAVAHDAAGNPLPVPPISQSRVPIPGVERPASATPNIAPSTAPEIKVIPKTEAGTNDQISYDSAGNIYRNGVKIDKTKEPETYKLFAAKAKEHEQKTKAAQRDTMSELIKGAAQRKAIINFLQ